MGVVCPCRTQSEKEGRGLLVGRTLAFRVRGSRRPQASADEDEGSVGPPALGNAAGGCGARIEGKCAM